MDERSAMGGFTVASFFMTKKPNKYADVSPQVKINGQHVTSNRGDVVRDFLVQADRQWYRYLEELVCRPGAPNPFKQIVEPDLRSAVQARGYLADKSTILKCAEEYQRHLENGGEIFGNDHFVNGVGETSRKIEKIRSGEHGFQGSFFVS